VDESDLAAQLRAVAEALRETARLQQQQFAFLRTLRPKPAQQPVSHRGPLNPRHQTWRGFVLDMQDLEARARREKLKVLKANVCQFGLDTVKTITRTMRWYGLGPRDWPPSTWNPDEDRPGGAGEKTRR
jgi:hypothetical protein